MINRIAQKITVILLCLIIISCNTESRDRVRDCLGQKSPGQVPEIFAPGILSDAGYRLHGFPTFSSLGQEICWPILRIEEGRPNGIIMSMKKLDDIWTNPQPLSFSGVGMEQAPAFSHDAQRLYFQSARTGGLGSLDI